MTQQPGPVRTPTRTAQRRQGRLRARTAAVVLAVVVVLAGCGDDGDGDLDLDTPTTSSSPQSSPSGSGDTPTESATVSVEEQAVLDAYYAFYDGVTQARADPVNSQEYLEPVATGAQFEATNGGIKATYLAGEEEVGEPILAPRVASIEGETAVVQDCQDTTDVVARRIGTTDPISVGRNPDSAETTLRMEDGVWKVAATAFQDDPAVFCG